MGNPLGLEEGLTTTGHSPFTRGDSIGHSLTNRPSPHTHTHTHNEDNLSSPVNCCWPSPAQRLLVSSTTRLMTIFYCLTALGTFRPLYLSLSLNLSFMLRPTVSQPVCLGIKAPIWGLRPDLCYCQTVAGLFMWGALSDERTGLSFTIAAGPRQRSHCESRGTRDRILLSQIWDFPFRRLLRLAGLRWWYSNPPPHGIHLFTLD
jgi:hypothetical protein